MNANRLSISIPIIVEGRYDKQRLQSVCDAVIITTDGFGIFKENEKRALLKRLAHNGKIIALTDSDGGGLVIRGFINNLLPRGSVINLYIPAVKGRERRKSEPSKEGLLGVEGTESELLYALLSPYADGSPPAERGKPLTKSELYADGFSGGAESAQKRRLLLAALRLPLNLSANAMTEAVNMLGLRAEYDEYIRKHGENFAQ